MPHRVQTGDRFLPQVTALRKRDRFFGPIRFLSQIVVAEVASVLRKTSFDPQRSQRVATGRNHSGGEESLPRLVASSERTVDQKARRSQKIGSPDCEIAAAQPGARFKLRTDKSCCREPLRRLLTADKK